MLFSVFNAFMIFVLAVGLAASYKYIRDRREVDVALTAFIAILCMSVFSAYIMILGASAAFSEWFGSLGRLCNAFKASLLF